MKLFVTGPYSIDKYLLVLDINKISPYKYIVPQRFSTDKNNENYIYIENSILNQGYKNNSFLFICLNRETLLFEGITMEEFDKSDIIPIELKEFNNISESILENNEILLIWIDTKKKINHQQSKKDINETKFLIDRINYAKLKYLYFCDKTTEFIFNGINEYLNSKDDIKQLKTILEKYQ